MWCMEDSVGASLKAHVDEGEATHVHKRRFETEFGKRRQNNLGLDMCLTLRSWFQGWSLFLLLKTVHFQL